MKGYTVYTKNTGVEISATTAKKEGNGEVRKEGRVMLRFFGFGEKSQESIRFILNPVETYWIFLKTVEISRSGGKESFVHKFTNKDEEISTTLTLEKWEREGKNGYAMNIKRGESRISVSMDIAHFLFVGELLRSLSTEQAWSQYKEAEEGIETEEAAKDSGQSPDNSIQGQASEPTHESAVEGKSEKTVSEEANTEEPRAEKPVQKPAAGSNNGSGKRFGAVIDAVSEDGKTIKVGDLSLKLTDKTKNEAGELKAGMKINLYYKGERANGIYPAKKQ